MTTNKLPCIHCTIWLFAHSLRNLGFSHSLNTHKNIVYLILLYSAFQRKHRVPIALHSASTLQQREFKKKSLWEYFEFKIFTMNDCLHIHRVISGSPRVWITPRQSTRWAPTVEIFWELLFRFWERNSQITKSQVAVNETWNTAEEIVAPTNDFRFG